MFIILCSNLRALPFTQVSIDDPFISEVTTLASEQNYLLLSSSSDWSLSPPSHTRAPLSSFTTAILDATNIGNTTNTGNVTNNGHTTNTGGITTDHITPGLPNQIKKGDFEKLDTVIVRRCNSALNINNHSMGITLGLLKVPQIR